MAGIGIKMGRFFKKRRLISSHVAGSAYSVLITLAPMLLVILTIFLMQFLLGYTDAAYNDRQLYQVTMLYIFIFSLILSSPLNAVLSRFVSDVIFEEKFGDIMAAFYTGFIIIMCLVSLTAVPFCMYEYFVGGVNIIYVITSLICFCSLTLVFYTMIYMSICKKYSKIAFFYLIGMFSSVILSLILVKAFHAPITYSMLLSMAVGFIIIAALGHAQICRYFKDNSRDYKKVLRYICNNYKLVIANFLYIMGMFVHNFVFWNSQLRNITVNTFISAETYDFASSIAMFTNISCSVIFTVLIELHFNERYKQYIEAINGGRLIDIKKTKSRMFRTLSDQLMSIVRIQFIISTVVFIVCLIFLQKAGYAGTIMQLYPGLAAGFFILYIMYSSFLFLYYYNDVNGAMYTSMIFFTVTLIISIFVMKLDTIWYGMGLVAGAFAGWTFAFFRLSWIEKNIDIHTFCVGTIIKKVKGKRPDSLVYKRRQL